MVFTVRQYRQVEHPAILHSAARQARVHHRHAIVREAHNAGFVHPPQFGQFLTAQTHRHRADRKQTRATHGRRPPQHKLRDRWRIVDGLGIGHRRHRRKAASRRCCQSGGNRFFVLEARLAEVHVHVQESWCHDTALGCNDAWRRARITTRTL